MEKNFTRALFLFIILGLLALLLLAILAVREWLATESGLNPQGSAYEINPDDAGRLWISDFKAKEIWGVDPSSGSYQVYSVSGFPVDARQENGWLWWADGRSNIIGRVSVSDGTYSQWRVPDAYGFLGTNLDAQGRLYATDSSNPFLYRLDPGESILCTYSLPGFGASNYIVRDGDYLWIGDSFDSVIFRLQIVDAQLTWWSLPSDSSPFGMAVDTSGSIWFADQGTNSISQLDPATNQLISYVLPNGSNPQMVAVQSGAIWYTEQTLPSIGRLDSLVADHSIASLTFSDQQLTPNCYSISPSSSGKVPISTGNLNWQKITYTPLVNAAGWQVFQLPESSDPWGIALIGFGYVVDPGRQVLIRFEPT
jgi:streptogramin lyase